MEIDSKQECNYISYTSMRLGSISDFHFEKGTFCDTILK